MSWFYLALLAPLLYAITNLIDDTLVRRVFKGPYFTAMVGGFFGALPLISLFFIPTTAISLQLGGLMVLAGLLTPLFYYCYFLALEREQPSIVVAMLGLVPATLPFLAHHFLHEQLLTTQIIGFVIVLVASLLLSMTEIKRFKFSAAIFPILIAVILWDVVSLLTKHVYDHTSFYSAYMCYSVGMGLAGLYFGYLMYYMHSNNTLSKIKKSFRRYWPLLVLGELFALSAEFTSNLAISRGPLSLVRVMEGIQPIYVLLIAFVGYPFLPKYFREAAEGGFMKKLALMLVIIVGLVFIYSAI